MKNFFERSHLYPSGSTVQETPETEVAAETVGTQAPETESTERDKNSAIKNDAVFMPGIYPDGGLDRINEPSDQERE